MPLRSEYEVTVGSSTVFCDSLEEAVAERHRAKAIDPAAEVRVVRVVREPVDLAALPERTCG